MARAVSTESGDTRTLQLLSAADTLLNRFTEKSVAALRNASLSAVFPAGFLVKAAVRFFDDSLRGSISIFSSGSGCGSGSGGAFGFVLPTFTLHLYFFFPTFAVIYAVPFFKPLIVTVLRRLPFIFTIFTIFLLLLFQITRFLAFFSLIVVFSPFLRSQSSLKEKVLKQH